MAFRPFFIVFVSIVNIFLMMVLTSLMTMSDPTFTVANAKKVPELTSTALKMHKAYTNSPPHNTNLYDIMEVSPNATLAQITKSYRILSRQYHPDKQARQKQESGETSRGQDIGHQRFQQIQKAYEILSSDSKRLPYHRYGLIDPNLAAFLLSPESYFQHLQQQHCHGHSFSKSASMNVAPLFETLDRELLRLMGYEESMLENLAILTDAANYGYGTDISACIEEHRINTIAALLLETIRPIVEGRIDSHHYAHLLSQDCDRWKRLPLGAHIIRSVGRAYRHEGREFLQRYKNNVDAYSLESRNKIRVTKKQMTLQLKTNVLIRFRRKWRSSKDILEAAAVSGRLALEQYLMNEQERKRKQKQLKKQQRIKKTLKAIECSDNECENSTGDSYLPQMDDFIWNEDSSISLEDLEEDEKNLERFKVRKSLLQTLQLEALWKVCKIDLDRIVRRACGMILSEEYFFYPSYQPSSEFYINSIGSSDGWVTSSGTTIDSEFAKVAAAEAMIMVGDIMVQRSKEGTSWKQ